jgi:hypothetical protein
VAAVVVGGMLRLIPIPPSGDTTPPPAAPVQTQTAASFHHIVLPDLAVIQGSGISAASIAAIGAIHGVRQVLALDGAAITSEGTKVNVIGVNAQQFRAWTPLRTASDQKLWTSLGSGGFIASPPTRRKLGLYKGIDYPLTGVATVGMQFAGAAALGVGGIDLVVSNQYSARLGLVHNVAALISAPAMTMAKLRREVGDALGTAGGTLVTLRPQAPALTPAQVNTKQKPTSYIQLFQESAALYCPGLPWTVLAAIGQIESGDGANMGPSSAGALGPMQFLPSTWATWGTTAFGETGPPNVMDPFDAVPSAARYLCAAGGATSSGLPTAIFAYNHANWYVSEVLSLAQQYAQAYG